MRRLSDPPCGDRTDWVRIGTLSDAELAIACADDPDIVFAPGMAPDPDDWRTPAEADAGIDKASVAHRAAAFHAVRR